MAPLLALLLVLAACDGILAQTPRLASSGIAAQHGDSGSGLLRGVDSAGAPRVAAECPAGFGSKAGVCAQCGEGTFSNGSAPCEPCPAGTFAPLPGLARCVACGAGEVSLGGDSQCVFCPSGTVANQVRTHCDRCPRGSWSLSGDAACRLCAPGTFNEREGEPGCEECGRGRFNPEQGSVSPLSCVPCPAGRFCPYTANVAALECDPQGVAPQAGLAACSPCPWLFYADPNRLGCKAHGSFYAIFLCTLLSVAAALVGVVKCPRLAWSRLETLDGLI
jgi:hypothetical protein